MLYDVGLKHDEQDYTFKHWQGQQASLRRLWPKNRPRIFHDDEWATLIRHRDLIRGWFVQRRGETPSAGLL